jgi:hypothetical protein
MSQEQSKQSWRIDEGNGTALQILSVDDTYKWDICESPDNKFVLKFSGKCGGASVIALYPRGCAYPALTSPAAPDGRIRK